MKHAFPPSHQATAGDRRSNSYANAPRPPRAKERSAQGSARSGKPSGSEPERTTRPPHGRPQPSGGDRERSANYRDHGPNRRDDRQEGGGRMQPFDQEAPSEPLAPRGLARDEIKVHGVNACMALWRRRPEAVIRLYVTQARLADVGELLRWSAQRRLAYHIVTTEDLNRVAGSVHHEGLCILAKIHPALDDRTLLAQVAARQPETLLYLDGVGNPHNIGAILRTAAHFGIPYIAGAAMPDLSPSAIRVAEGGAEHVAIAPLAEPGKTLANLRAKGYVLIGASGEGGIPLPELELPERCIFALGHEVRGLSKELRSQLDLIVSIPGTGAVESLNVSTAAAILLAEAWRQRAGKAPQRPRQGKSS